MYKKIDNKQRVLSQLNFIISEISFAIETTKEVPDENFFGTTAEGIRNLLAHEYLSVEEPEILSILQQDLPNLLPVAQQMKRDIENGRFDKLSAFNQI